MANHAGVILNFYTKLDGNRHFIDISTNTGTDYTCFYLYN